MDPIRKPKSRSLAADDKTVMMMLYMDNVVYRGEAIMKSGIRASIWMRTQGAPEYINMLKAQAVLLTGATARPMIYPELLIATADMIAYHIAPPSPPEACDFDETEQNRVMETVTVLVGGFIFNGHMRIATLSDSLTAITSNRAPWISLYNVQISSLLLPAMGVIKVPQVQVRPSKITFAFLPESQS